jgi:predicted dehydrogenase
MKIKRREFIRSATIAGVGTAALTAGQASPVINIEDQQKKSTPKLSDRLRVGFIGVGNRGTDHINITLGMKNVDIAAICDISQPSLDRIKGVIAGEKFPEPKVYTGSEYAYLDMLGKESLDAVIIATPWEWHAKMAVAGMEAGVYTGIEVPACVTIDQAWDLVNVHEKTGTNIMFLENACYDRSYLAVLNMVRQGVFGEMLHCRCGYLHDLRGVKFNDGVSYDYIPGHPLKFGKDAIAEAQWRGLHSIRRNGDLYPTHGIGPVAQLLDINNGNRFLTISSTATKARGLKKYIEEYGGTDHPLSKIQWNCGDIVNSVIRCENGETIIVTHNCNNPRPHDSDSLVQGTSGLWFGDWKKIYIEKKTATKDQYEPDDEWITKYEHKYWRDMQGKESEFGHGNIDFISLAFFYEAVKNKKPAPITVYDGALWSAIAELSERSIARGGTPVEFPDFTRGQWIKYKGEKSFAPDEKFPVLTDRVIKY